MPNSFIASLFALFIVVCAPVAHANTQEVDRIIAIVDDDVVLASELMERMMVVERNLQNNNRQIDRQQLQQEVVNQLIIESIQLQMAFRAGVRISDAELNASVEKIAQSNGLSLNAFRQALEKEGMSYLAMREQVRRDLMLKRVQQGMVNRRVQISDEEVENFILTEEGSKLVQPEFRLAHVLIPVEDSSDPAQVNAARSVADTLSQRIQGGESFEAVLKSTSRDSVNVTDLGWRKSSDLPSIFIDVAPTLSEGQTSTPIESASGFHLVNLIGKRGADETVAQTKARHILLKASAIRDETATEAEISTLRQRILDGEDFAELAREFSEDIGSAAEGGDLGWTNPGQLVKEFQDTMDNTKIDDISTPFRSEFGWHILQVLERRDKDITENLQRNIAKNYLYQRKFDDELDAWLQKIRDEAYVDIK